MPICTTKSGGLGFCVKSLLGWEYVVKCEELGIARLLAFMHWKLLFFFVWRIPLRISRVFFYLNFHRVFVVCECLSLWVFEQVGNHPFLMADQGSQILWCLQWKPIWTVKFCWPSVATTSFRNKNSDAPCTDCLPTVGEQWHLSEGHVGKYSIRGASGKQFSTELSVTNCWYSGNFFQHCWQWVHRRWS